MLQNHYDNDTHHTNGFTLVELAIALMVIGLLIGGVLKGQELIENAKATAAMRQFKAYDAAVMIFQNSYNALPGDIKKPNRIPNCDTPTCNIAGNGDKKVQEIAGLTPRFVEIGNFFSHLSKAGMIQGVEGGTATEMTSAYYDRQSVEADLFFPMTPIDLNVGIQYHSSRPYAFSAHGHFYHLFWQPTSSPPTRLVMMIDSKMDDGKPFTGDIGLNEAGDCPVTDFPSSDPAQMATIEYDLSYPGETECAVLIKTGW